MSSEVHKLLSASVRFCKGDFSPDVLSFLVETVTAAVEDAEVMDQEETMMLLLGELHKYPLAICLLVISTLFLLVRSFVIPLLLNLFLLVHFIQMLD